jgi:hypothetical protein
MGKCAHTTASPCLNRLETTDALRGSCWNHHFRTSLGKPKPASELEYKPKNRSGWIKHMSYMMNHSEPGQPANRPATKNPGDESPFDAEFFIVQGINFKCMAYRDERGKWRGAFNHLELPGMIQILG